MEQNTSFKDIIIDRGISFDIIKKKEKIRDVRKMREEFKNAINKLKGGK